MEMMRDYGVRILHAYENKRVGQVIYPPAMLRGKLIQAGLVERVAEPEQLEPTAPQGLQGLEPAQIVRPVPMHEPETNPEPVTAVIAEPVSQEPAAAKRRGKAR
jgi:hypothetical protein